MPNVTDELNDLAIEQSHRVKMIFYPTAWASATNSNHNWTITNFPPNPRNIIPHSPGVYAFVVEPELFDFSASSGLFYVGKATNLYERIGAYISEIGKDFSKVRRPHIWTMINRWDGHLKYYFTETATVNEAEDLEDEMISAFRPFFNRAFEAEVSNRMRAFT